MLNKLKGKAEPKSGFRSFLHHPRTFYWAAVAVALSAAMIFGIGVLNRYQDETGCGSLGNAPANFIYALNGDFALGPGDHLCVGLESSSVAASPSNSDNAGGAKEKQSRDPDKTERQWQWITSLSPQLENWSPLIPADEKCSEASYSLKIQGFSINGRVDYRTEVVRNESNEDVTNVRCFVRFIMPRSSDAVASDAQLVRGIWGGRAADGFRWTPKFWKWGTTSVGMAVCDGDGFCHALGNAKLRGFFPWMMVFGLIFMASALLLLAIAISKFNLLRDRVGGSYSLAATQFVFWSVIIVGGYIWIFLFTGLVTGVLNASVLGLLGIYTVTSYAATTDHRQLQKLGASRSLTPNKKAQREVSEGFWKDILTDPNFDKNVIVNGIANSSDNIVPQRVVTVVWSIIVALIIAQSILFSFSFPELDATILGLSGMSSGAYAWFKKLKVRI